MALTAELRVKMSAVQTGANDLGAISFKPGVDKVLQFASGILANQADLVWTDEQTLAASATVTLDLAGSLTDAFGTVLAGAELVALLVTANAANTNDVVVGGATAPVVIFGGTTPTFAVKPGGFLAFAAPGAAGQAPITATSADGLKITNSAAGTAVTFQVFLLMRSA